MIYQAFSTPGGWDSFKFLKLHKPRLPTEGEGNPPERCYLAFCKACLLNGWTTWLVVSNQLGQEKRRREVDFLMNSDDLGDSRRN